MDVFRRYVHLRLHCLSFSTWVGCCAFRGATHGHLPGRRVGSLRSPNRHVSERQGHGGGAPGGGPLRSRPSPGPRIGSAGCTWGPGRWRGVRSGSLRSWPTSSHLDLCLWAKSTLRPSGQGPCWQSGPCFPLRRAVISPPSTSSAPVCQEGTVPWAGAI